MHLFVGRNPPHMSTLFLSFLLMPLSHGEKAEAFPLKH